MNFSLMPMINQAVTIIANRKITTTAVAAIKDVNNIKEAVKTASFFIRFLRCYPLFLC